MVSVIIPSYNREKTIERSIRSVLNQTYRDMEVWVIDDCSTDKTENVVAEIMQEDNRLKYHRLDSNSGACVARNVGLELASGEYIAFQDSDDEWMPNKLEQQIEVMKKNNALISFCQLNKINYASDPYIFPVRKGGLVDRNELLRDSIVSTQTIVARKECFDAIKFDPEMPRYQDYDICIRLSAVYDFYFVDTPLVNMYLQDDSITQNWNKMILALTRIQNKYADTISKYKDMEFYICRMVCKAKKRCGKKYLKDICRCISVDPIGSVALIVRKVLRFNRD